ncbi:tetratricopeptide repeat protein [Clostridium omnivorum]|uniref:Tetratricopeptide repeat protein n=1 Tax=Clostridium omnivorum TaxID=1604902 RepID=A0ABQ5N490_9CLOT|nr:hypothetical protein [Clostridium sp. E14]GLC30057.1 hypothetical protein bsdE14_14670 [Clostridium sp. E14]
MRSVIVISGCIIVIASFIYKKSYKPKTKNDYMKVLEMHLVGKRWKRAIDLALEILDKFTLDTEEMITVLFTISNSYYKLKEYELAVNYYEKTFEKLFSYEKKFHYAEGLVWTIDCLIKLGRNTDAKSLYNKIVNEIEDKKEIKRLNIFAKNNNLIAE